MMLLVSQMMAIAMVDDVGHVNGLRSDRRQRDHHACGGINRGRYDSAVDGDSFDQVISL